MSDALLQVRDLRVHYGAIQALRGVTLEVPAGEVVTLIGANGAGKTTTLRAVSRMVKASGGAVRFGGEDVGGLASHDLVARGMAHAPEGRGIFLNLTVKENLDLGAYLRTDRDGIVGDLDHVYQLFPLLKERRAQISGTLSIEVLEDGLHALTLDLSGVGLRRASLDGQTASIGRGPDGKPVLFVQGKGRHTLALEIVAPLETAAAQQVLTFRLPQPPAARFRRRLSGTTMINWANLYALLKSSPIPRGSSVTQLFLFPSHIPARSLISALRSNSADGSGSFSAVDWSWR